MRPVAVAGRLKLARSSDGVVLLLIAILGATVLLGSVGLDVLLLPHDATLGLDFSAFYAAGVALRRGDDPYSWAQLRLIEHHLRSIGDPHRVMSFDSYANPPFFTVLMASLTALPVDVAYVSWLAASILALLAGLAVMARTYGMERWSVGACCCFLR